MALKRKHGAEEPQDNDGTLKNPRKGFQVGPANLPDGTYRRKAQKIKQDLIHKAKVKKSYTKLKSREPQPQPKSSYLLPSPEDATTPTTLDLHPDRQAMLDKPIPLLPLNTTSQIQHPRPRKPKPPKAIPFKKEAQLAQQRKEEAEARRKAIEEASRQRALKIEEKERFRRAMAKARTGGKNGQRKLGRESVVLLEKVRRVMGERGFEEG